MKSGRRLTASQVLDLADREPVRRRFRLDDDDLARIQGWVAESGIHNVETLLRMKAAGFNGFLIGEQFMKTPDPAIAFASFIDQLKSNFNESKGLRNDATRSGEEA